MNDTILLLKVFCKLQCIRYYAVQFNSNLVQQSFESIVDSYLANNVGLTTNFLSMKLAAALKENLLTLNSDNLLKQVGFGNSDKLTRNDFIRSDKIF